MIDSRNQKTWFVTAGYGTSGFQRERSGK